jgi:hypothetical protein
MISYRLAVCALAILAPAVLSKPALADESPAMNKVIVNNPDDRLNSIPVNWWTFSHESPQDVTNTISVRHARIIDISVEQVSPSFAFTVTYVENSGPYAKGWYWYFGIDAAALANAISTTNARFRGAAGDDVALRQCTHKRNYRHLWRP